MITIEMVMLAGLGFLTAALLALFLAPLYRRRSGRLAIEALKRSMPLTEAEIRADKDRVRAEYAILIHKLEMKVDEASDAAARQKVELNRRDAAISELEEEVGRQSTFMDEHENARRVLEQTIMDRLPKVEYRLAEAKKLLFQRDREIVGLSQSSEKQIRALEEAKQINTQQTDEIHRLKAALNTRAARKREGLGDPRFDGEVALRTEIESLRAETRDQSALIARLQAMLVRAGPAAQSGGDRNKAAGSGGTNNEAIRPARVVGRLKSDLAEARQPKLVAVNSSAETNETDNAKVAAEQRKLKSANEDQTAEISRLKAALQTYEAADKDERGVKESKIALKARLSALQALSDEYSVTIQSLRAEVASGNERLARQAAYFMEEMRRLGGGTLPASGSSGRRRDSPASLSEKRPLVERINETGTKRKSKKDEKRNHGQPENTQASSGFVKARAETGVSDHSQALTDASDSSEGEVAKSGKAKQQRKSRLLERITGIEKSSV